MAFPNSTIEQIARATEEKLSNIEKLTQELKKETV
jgi:hypothetical protein